jgi:SPP1 gp7 family putative phage head morphogenesis protein
VPSAALIREIQARRLVRQASTGRRARRPARVPRPREPRAARVAYAAILKAIVREIADIIRLNVTPALLQIEREAAADKPVRQDQAPETIERVIGNVRLQIGQRFAPARVQEIAREQAGRINRFNRGETERMFRSVLAIDLGADPNLAPQIAAFVRDNVRLISSIHEDLLFEVDGIISRGARQGLRASEMAEQIEQRFGVTESRAQLIARDQTASLNGDLAQARQQALGVEEYVWRTSMDERVRPEHAEREGEKFRWDDPPEDGHPGQPINCRCTAEPVLDEILAAL